MGTAPRETASGRAGKRNGRDEGPSRANERGLRERHQDG